jgi:hypothetical protein
MIPPTQPARSNTPVPSVSRHDIGTLSVLRHTTANRIFETAAMEYVTYTPSRDANCARKVKETHRTHVKLSDTQNSGNLPVNERKPLAYRSQICLK